MHIYAICLYIKLHFYIITAVLNVQLKVVMLNLNLVHLEGDVLCMYIYNMHIYAICIYIIALLYNKNHKQDLNTRYDIWRAR